ncbi:testis-specific gene 13 protein isoform X2 [Ornithorhynchus anatinus]|uniref:testis-specific gene 13 protein isoform X2 n=1 Tax=Ornithorhynchus anatinus TaxID=9258 RepID=UPI0019D4D695|nr:testis-specific gene 13 protein isoform X2 [Ornithorhynchus anatinus]
MQEARDLPKNNNLEASDSLEWTQEITMKSKFVLENLQEYTIQPDLAQYYKPFEPSKLQQFTTHFRQDKGLLFRVLEFDQEMTTLILTNNPLPTLINWQGEGTLSRYFSQDLLNEKPQKSVERIRFPPLVPQQKTERARRNKTFTVTLGEDPKPKQKQWFRFSTDSDFKCEGRFSKGYVKKKQKKMYPQLRFAPVPKTADEMPRLAPGESGAMKSRRDSAVPKEPLTLATLLEENPTKVVPGEHSFRYGRAPQWLVNNAVVQR